jgi:hypothetical protein
MMYCIIDSMAVFQVQGQPLAGGKLRFPALIVKTPLIEMA